MKLLSLSASPTMPLSSSSSSNIFVGVGDLWFGSLLIHNAALKPCELNPSVFLPSSFILSECNRSFFTKTHNWKLVRTSTHSEQVIQKKNLKDLNLDYKIFTTQFDEITKAENLENADEANKLRKTLDQQLIGFQDVITLSLIHISEPTRPLSISYAVFCL